MYWYWCHILRIHKNAQTASNSRAIKFPVALMEADLPCLPKPSWQKGFSPGPGPPGDDEARLLDGLRRVQRRTSAPLAFWQPRTKRSKTTLLRQRGLPMPAGAWPLRFAQPKLLLSCSPRRLLAARAYQGPGGQQGVERRPDQHRTEPVHDSLKYIRREQGPNSSQPGTGSGSSTQRQEGGQRDRPAPRTSREPQSWQGQRSGSPYRQDQQHAGQQRRAPPDSMQRQPWQQQESWAQRSSKGHERPPSSRQSYAGRYDDCPRTPSLVLQGEAVYGISTITAAVAANRRELHTLYVQAGVLAVQGSPACRPPHNLSQCSDLS